jgi:putative MATE family efflux protein
MDTPTVPAAASASPPPPPPPAADAPKFVTGSLLRHILVMTGTGAVGLVAIFIGEFANLVFLAQLPDPAVVPAYGYSSAIVFLTISIGIGLAIAAAALVAPAVGARERARARRLATHSLLATLLVSIVASGLVLLAAPVLLDAMGARGRTHDLAMSYLTIVVPSLAPLAIGMTATGILRSVGDAGRAMNVTLGGAIVNVILDPILIFGAGLGLEGAAWAVVLSRIAVMAVGLYGVMRIHDLAGWPAWRPFVADAIPIAAIAVPAILTNIATPVSNALVTAAVAVHGDGAVAGWAAIGRIAPVAFGAIFALSGTVGPILGQNYGAGEMARMRRAFTLSLWVTAAFTAVAWLALALSAEALAGLVRATGDAADLVVLFCRWLAPLFVFMGGLFVANAAFNTLGRAPLSTSLNWGRATLGTVPFIWLGSLWGGAPGVMIGHMAGGIAFGIIAVWLGYRHMDALADGRATVRRRGV